jgi:curved DNA-binding protein CbpA
MMRKTRETVKRAFFGQEEEPRRCDAPGCTAEGIYRAPRSKADLASHYMFCLDHVRQYNLNWNYFAGMSTDEIEAQIRRDTVWDRPTWPFAGRNTRTAWHGQDAQSDAFRFADSESEAPRRRFSADEERALAVLELEPPVTRERVKAQYKALVKRHHPDANGGDRLAEERLKDINLAYSTLKAAALP